ncbi:MAG: hypothetical protein WCC84_11805, partial [Candidatus Cybelea sp.]
SPSGVVPVRVQGPPATKSWIDATASRGDLLYIAATPIFPNGVVYVYTYPQRKLVGTLTGFAEPFGECTDSAGDVFIVAFSNTSSSLSSTIYEYAHGGTSPIATLSDPNVAFSCAVDPMTGNLAAAGDGVAVYQHAAGNPTIYNSSDAFKFCGYDNHGNLYLTARSDHYGNQAQLVRLSSGSNEFDQIQLGTKLYAGIRLWPSVQWDGKHMTVSSNPNGNPISIYRLRISGSSATVIGTTEVSSAKNNYSGQTWIRGDTIIGTGNTKRAYESAFFWRYPTGGVARREIKQVGNVRNPEASGVTVSVARSR